MRLATVTPFTLLAVLAALVAAPAAQAQWKWRDAGGQIHYSDRPPPAGTVGVQILKGTQPPPAPATARNAAPGAAQPAAPGTAPPTATAGKPASNATAAPPTPENRLADLQMRLKQQEAQRAAAERKEQEAEQKAALRNQACADLASGIRTLESGMRVVTVNAQGEQEFLSDEERAVRLERLRRDQRALCLTS
jgi:hypothetical protein